MKIQRLSKEEVQELINTNLNDLIDNMLNGFNREEKANFATHIASKPTQSNGGSTGDRLIRLIQEKPSL